MMPGELSKTLRRWRAEAGLSQAELSDKAGVSRAYVAQLELGNRKRIGWDIAKKLCSSLGHPVTDLPSETVGLGTQEGPYWDAVRELVAALSDPTRQEAIEILRILKLRDERRHAGRERKPDIGPSRPAAPRVLAGAA